MLGLSLFLVLFFDFKVSAIFFNTYQLSTPLFCNYPPPIIMFTQWSATETHCLKSSPIDCASVHDSQLGLWVKPTSVLIHKSH
jgi:hypothetical protein